MLVLVLAGCGGGYVGGEPGRGPPVTQQTSTDSRQGELPTQTARGNHTVHVFPPFLPTLQGHVLEHTAADPAGLLFPGDRADHMSVRYLMDRYRPASESAGDRT